jgi:hypothetical protein
MRHNLQGTGCRHMTTTTDARSPRWTFRRTLQLIGAACCVFLLSECVGPKLEYKRDRFHDTLTLSDGQRVKVEIKVASKEYPGVGWPVYYSSMDIRNSEGVPLVPTWVSARSVRPMLVDHRPDGSGWILVAAPQSCDGWMEIGRPALPYAAFGLENGRWTRVPLPASLHGRAANLQFTISIKRHWAVRLERLRLLRSPVLLEYVYHLNEQDGYPRWPLNSWSSQVSGRDVSCEPNRVTAVGQYG